MLQYLTRSACALLVLSLTCLASAQVVLEDFEAGREWQIMKAEERAAACQVVDAPMRKGKSLKITWEKTRAKYVEPHLVKAIPAPGFDTSGKPYHGRVDLDVFSPGTAEPARMSVRFIDRHREVFQWMRQVDFDKAGWQTITFDIRPDNVTSHWGGNGGTADVMDGPVQLLGVTIDFVRDATPPDDAALRQITIDNITLHLPPGGKAAENAAEGKPDVDQAAPTRALNLDVVQVGLETGHRLHIVDPAAPKPAYLTLRSPVASPQAVRLELKARSLLGRTYDLTQDVVLPPNKTVEHFLPLPQDKQDFWWVYYTLADPQGRLPERTGREMLGVMTPNGNTPEYQSQGRFLFGMCAHTGRYDDATMQAEAYAAGLLGLDIIRGSMTWGGVQRTGPETFDWSKMDRIVELYKEQNIQIQYLLAYTPKWASTGNPNSGDWLDWARATPRMEAWENYVRQVASRYQNDIRYWELWNEPDLDFFRGTPDDYVQMCSVAYPIIKSIDPGMTVLSGGFSGIERKPGWLDEVMPRVRDDYDTLAIHIHGTFGRFQQAVDGRWKQLHDQYAADKPVYYNETGFSSPQDTIEGDTRQAVILVKKIAFAMGRGAVAYNWYDLRNDGDDPSDHEHRFGIITRDFRAKPGYIAYNNLIAQLRGHRLVKQLEAGKDQWLFLFKKDDRYVIVGWAQQPYAVGQLVVRTDAADAKRIDMLGNAETPVRLTDGSTLIALDTAPAYWVFEKANQPPQWRDQLLKLAGVPAFVPRQENELTFSFTNPLKRQARVSFEAKLPASLGGQAAHAEVVIGAGQTHTVSMPLRPTRTDVDYARPFTCMLSYHDDDHQFQGTTPISIRWAGVIREGSFTKEPTFTLDQPVQVYDLFRNDPNSIARVWKGPRDLSADAWIAATPTDLKLRLVVTDDQHVQVEKASDVWRSDSVQLVFLVPGQSGQWEINLARHNDGSSLVSAGMVPDGIEASGIDASLLKTAREGNTTTYDFALPLKAVGLTLPKLREGLYLSLLINEDDGEGRDGWIALSGGIGDSKDPSQYPLFVVQQD